MIYLNHMKLILPSEEYKESFIEAVKEYRAEGDMHRYDLDINFLENNFAKYVSQILAQANGESLPEGYVPQTTFWLVDNGEFIGRVSIRHTLTEELLKVGGHIGYDIRPSKRQKGYGKKILELALPKAKELGINRALVTCDETNIGSKKIIEANGGVLEDSYEQGDDKPRKLRYWINIG